MLREQQEIYLKLADALLAGLKVDEVKKTLQRGEKYYSDEYVVGNTAYFITLNLQPLWNAGEVSLYMCGYITTKNVEIADLNSLRLILVRRSIDSDFLDVDKESAKKTLAWMIEEFKDHIRNFSREGNKICNF